MLVKMRKTALSLIVAIMLFLFSVAAYADCPIEPCQVAYTQVAASVNTVSGDALLPGDQEFVLSFAGDCTLGAEHAMQSAPQSFLAVVKTDYQYPFQFASPYFLRDDFTLINLEGVFTEAKNPKQKAFRFKGPREYAAILTSGGIEAVTLTNNHALDYGEQGYEDTKTALENAKISYASFEDGFIFTTRRGLSIGVYGEYHLNFNPEKVQQGIKKLKERGADVIVAAFHWGSEGSYYFNFVQKKYALLAIDAGADLVVGHHPHVLQPVAFYKGKPILYSLGNFAYGGHTNPPDKDSVIVQQHVIKKASGTVLLGKTVLIPFCLSGKPNGNNYQPVPYEIGSEGYNRTLKKLLKPIR